MFKAGPEGSAFFSDCPNDLPLFNYTLQKSSFSHIFFLFEKDVKITGIMLKRIQHIVATIPNNGKNAVCKYLSVLYKLILQKYTRRFHGYQI